MPEMTTQEIADAVRAIARSAELNKCGDNCMINLSQRDIDSMNQAASIIHQCADRKLVELSCQTIVPNGLRDCAGSRDEWFQHDFCEQCRKYHSYGERKAINHD